MMLEDIINRLSKISQPQRLALYGCIIALVLVVYLFVMLFPSQDNMVLIEGKIAEHRAKLDETDEKVSTLEGLQVEIAELKVLLEESMEQLPKGEEIADLLKQISDNGRSSGLEIRKFERKKENINSSYDLVAEVPIEISVQGSFHRIAMFFDQISQMNRIVHVNNIEISIEDDDSGAEVVPLLVEGDIVAFRLLTPVELKAKEELEKKRKKKRR
jgi:type IV pilus assembly protein PilO